MSRILTDTLSDREVLASSAGAFVLLRLLSVDECRSGEWLAERMACSRGTVWNRVRAAEALGAGIEKLRGRGYRLAAPLDLLDPDRLVRRLRSMDATPRFECRIIDECASTSTLLMERVRRAPERLCIPYPALTCERQTAGRGRRGAPWHDALGGSLALSVAWRFAHGVGRLSGLPLAVAVAIAGALEQAGCRGVRLKWPNDLMIQAAGDDAGEPAMKLGGILTELVGEASGPSIAVIGVGLNVRLPDATRAVIGRPVADLLHQGGMDPAITRTDVLAHLLHGLGEGLVEFEREGFAPFRSRWLERHVWQGREVELRVAERSVAQGRALGVDDDGALLLASRRGLERFHSGDLSLRAA